MRLQRALQSPRAPVPLVERSPAPELRTPAAEAVEDAHDEHGNRFVLGALTGTDPGPAAAVLRERLQLAMAGIGGPDGNQARLARMRLPAPTGGEPLPEAVRVRVEAALGHDFAHVRIHADGAAGRAAAGLDAHAFAVGSHVWFGTGEFQPGTPEGDELLLHELVHVVQHDEHRLPARGVSDPADATEREAETVAADAVRTLGDMGEAAEVATPSIGEAPPDGAFASRAATPDPLAGLRKAVAAGSPGETTAAFAALDDSGRQALSADRGLLRDTLAHLDRDDARGILSALAPALPERLAFAAARFVGDAAALTASLRDAGITFARDLPRFAAAIAAEPGFVDAAVLGPLCDDGDAAGQIACLYADDVVQLLRAAWPAASPFVVLPAIAADMAGVAEAFRDALAGRTWLASDLATLGARIVASPAVDAWIDALVDLGELGALEVMVLLDAAGWGPPLARLSKAPPESVCALLGSHEVTDEAVRFAAMVARCSDDAALDLMRTIAPDRAVRTAVRGGWLTPELAVRLLPTAEGQTEVVRWIDLVSLLIPLAAYPTDLFPLVTSDLFAAAWFSEPLWAVWLGSNPARLAPLVSETDDPGLWLADLPPLFSGMMLQIASRDLPRWEAAAHHTRAGIELVLGAVPFVTDPACYETAWALLAVPSQQRDVLDTAWQLFTGVPILEPGAPTRSEPADIDVYADTAGNTWTFWKRPIPVRVDEAGMAAFVEAMRTVPRDEIQASNSIMFAANEEYLWQQTLPSSGAEHSWASPLLAPLRTSGNRDGEVVIRANGSDRMPVDGAVDTDAVSSDRDGVARAVGGGQDRTLAGGTDNRTTGDTGLTWLENHARHEFGHSVGAAILPGVPNGDAFAEAWAGWQKVSDADFRAAMFPLHATATLDFGGSPVTVTTADVADWCIGLIRTGSPPSPNVLSTAAGADALAPLTPLGGSVWRDQPGFRYVETLIAAYGLGGGIPDNAYDFQGEPPVVGGDVYLYASRWDKSLARYSKAAYDASLPTMGAYSLSSPREMFAEAFTKKYSGGGVPPALPTGDWNEYWRALEASPGVACHTAAPSAAPVTPAGSGEIEPPKPTLPT